MPEPFTDVDLPLPDRRAGKVRVSYALDGGRRLFVTTDRLSAFDRILAGVPYKGQVLNQLAAWWFNHTKDIVGNHFLGMPDPNATIALDVEPLPVEVIVRGHITGVTTTALWYRYNLGERRIYGYDVPDGLRKNQELPEAIITPTTKGGPTGHDERLDLDEIVARGDLTKKDWDFVKKAALALFARGRETARKAGLILVDTKYEFGRAKDGGIILIDEVHTPDSSRFWKLDSFKSRFEAGQEPELFDKEFVRIAYAEKGYRGDGDAPEMPKELWARTSVLYQTMFEKLTGQEFLPGEYPAGPRALRNLKREGIIQ